MITLAAQADLQARARQTLGASDAAIHGVVAELLAARGASGVLADVGCGTGQLWHKLRTRFSRCIGVDALRFEGLPDDIDFRPADVDRAPLPIADGAVDVAAAVETIEHLENPRALFRELARITRAGGYVLVSTPNQLSALSLLTLVARHQFAAFQENSYPAHRTALLEIDLRRIAAETGLSAIEIRYTAHGRVPLTAWHYPPAIARTFPRLLSDNVVLCARRG